VTKTCAIESHPWSNNSPKSKTVKNSTKKEKSKCMDQEPSGEDVPVRRACLPSVVVIIDMIVPKLNNL
jgi:hypothetical protein